MAMSREGSADNQGETSAARQVLEALAAAAKEMTDRFEETAHLAERLNTALETKVNEFFAEMSQQTDFQVSKQLANLQVEKDSIIADLLKLRHEELHVVLSIAEKLNAAIIEKVDEIFADFKKEAQEHLETYRTNLNKKETDIAQSATLLRLALRDKLNEQLEQLNDTALEQKSELKATLTRNTKLTRGEAEIGVDVLSRQREALIARLQKEGSEKINALEQKMDTIASSQSQSFEKQLSEYSKLQELAKVEIEDKLKLQDDLPSAFANLCSESSKMQLSVHENHFANLSLKHRGEVSSIQHDLESKIELAQTHSQNLLKQSISMYSEKANTLLAGFEKNVRSARVLLPSSDAENEASIEMLVERLKKELKRSANDTFLEGKGTIEHDFARFRSKLSADSQASTDEMDAYSAEALDEARKISREHKNILNDLSRRLNALAQIVDDPTQLESLFSLLDDKQV